MPNVGWARGVESDAADNIPPSLVGRRSMDTVCQLSQVLARLLAASFATRVLLLWTMPPGITTGWLAEKRRAKCGSSL